MNRAERYKRNYALIRNKYFDHKLAQASRTWSDERIYKELGIRVGRTTPELTPLTAENITRGKRKYANYQYGIEVGLTPAESNKVTNYKKSKIKSTRDYLRARTKRQRMDLWSSWARHTSPMPPAIEREAREINRATILANGRRRPRRAGSAAEGDAYLTISRPIEKTLLLGVFT